MRTKNFVLALAGACVSTSAAQDIQLTAWKLRANGSFEFTINGAPSVYAAYSSSDLTNWNVLGAISNSTGTVVFTNAVQIGADAKFFRALRQAVPTNMVFIPANTFTMGSAASEPGHMANEGPQTIVTLSRGFWIGKYEVTQDEYLSVTGTNPSEFPGGSNPVSSVSWPASTNFCALLTQRELAAGRIPPGSHFRLPTEAEWECAARGGTTTQFSYGDDPTYEHTSDYAWHSMNALRPVGQKLPNSWGLYDTMGNVFEWCQDWLGPLPGGSVVDPQGPPNNEIGWKVMRGGAFDYSQGDCRAARRMFFGNHPALVDWDLGFRVVLAIEP